MPALAALIEDLVAANRILAGLDVLDGFGHVSVRHPDHADRYLLSRSVAPELVTRDDIMTFDLNSLAQDGDTRTPYLERFIHGEIYARRPDVQLGRAQPRAGGGAVRGVVGARCGRSTT